ncbi:MAG: polysaccharide lyase family protein [Fimbriimonas sp.]|nr:polysaccharide lyase family protein [Fimbriimonas sp.]
MIVDLLFACVALPFIQSSVLWQIGQPDGTPAGFGLAPGHFRDYHTDALFVVGASRESDIPYVLPGPLDTWAGSRSHRADIFFGLSGAKPRGSARLTIDFADTQATSPPRLQLLMNGRIVSSWQAPAGSGDDVVEGRSQRGMTCHWVSEIPSGCLRNGNNDLSIQTLSGSWVLYDSLKFESFGDLCSVPVKDGVFVSPLPQRQVILETPTGPRQPVDFDVANLGHPVAATICLDRGDPIPVQLRSGRQTVTAMIRPQSPTPSGVGQKKERLAIYIHTDHLDSKGFLEVEAVRPWIVYLLPHSHVDIGYTDIQAKVAEMHRRNLFDALKVAKESRGFGTDDRYRFTMEATWILDNFLADGSPDELRQVADAFQSGIFDCSANYCNVLTALMRPEELMRSYAFSGRLSQWLGISLHTATQTDVPGVTWGAVDAMSQAGIRHLVLMPNPSDRIGGVLSAWQDKPFFWSSPSGKSRVLVWETTSYGTAHGLRHFNGDRSRIYRTSDPSKDFADDYIFPRLSQLASSNYPYDVLAMPWSGTDNFPIDGDVPRAVQNWNQKYVVPHLVCSTASNACMQLVERFGKRIPVVRGDFTPYWEDGAGSSARETATNRASADRLVQAETLAAMTAPERYDAKAFWDGWRNVILYSEHTWGAYNSVSEPDSEFVKAQWAIKQSFATHADDISHRLLSSFSAGRIEAVVSVTNTNSWPRTDLVTLSRSQSESGDRVVDDYGHPLPSQRLKSGRLAVLVKNLPGISTLTLHVTAGSPCVAERASAVGQTIESPEWRIDLSTDGNQVVRLWHKRLKHDFVHPPFDLNRYEYLPGSDIKNLQLDRSIGYDVIESGPLVAQIRVRCQAPGTRGVSKEIQVVAGLDRVDFSDEIDKVAVRTKEGVHIPFPFAVSEGVLRIHTPWAIVRPDLDQIAGSNKNWFCSQYFVDISNGGYGITWTSLDAPLMEVGGITARMLDGGYDPKQWIEHLGPTQTIVSWALNNHWYTNYRADQSGLLTYRYSIRAHDQYNDAEAYRFGVGLAQPLIVGSLPAVLPLLAIDDPNVVVTSLKPSEDGHATIVRLWCLGGRPRSIRIRWSGSAGVRSLSDLSERPLHSIGESLSMSGWQVVTIRVERANAASGKL